ncbi:ABC transporter ATP-binding protein [Aureimonas fodinaquatilis]|uniref:ABC transporter ATP-binding protein n=1 Tax=Aureimonas fodinaquatilis TaxID=2565783 RepID=A0A5B0DUB6_9HYPH|nr:ABC transporter ATP-binding protein [Aureimonas fodinaquatilis]KAA0969535.1 ABC transporter ATP-binding protein [Aureimonas fodinaquatilis]
MLSTHASSNSTGSVRAGAAEPLLDVRNIDVAFATRHGPLLAIDDVSMSIAAGEIVGVVGESGAGKSLTGSAIIGLLDPPGYLAAGEIVFDGQRIDNLPANKMRRIRGRHISMIFQDPLTSLDPLYSVGHQLCETICTHLPLSRQQARAKAIALLDSVGVPAAAERIDHYPHQFSGGMRQRVVIALALCTEPRLIIADEPTTALDVSVQAQIITLLKTMCHERGTAVMLVTHDMGVIAEAADRVIVMYAGRVVEDGPVAEVVHNACHPYTRGLMGAIPSIGDDLERLAQIDGSMPRLSERTKACAFHPRCPRAMDICRQSQPPLVQLSDRKVACFLFTGTTGEAQ